VPKNATSTKVAVRETFSANWGNGPRHRPDCRRRSFIVAGAWRASVYIVCGLLGSSLKVVQNEFDAFEARLKLQDDISPPENIDVAKHN
jgi:hypothetical protein